jgi:SAM-dependent methyltransferase
MELKRKQCRCCGNNTFLRLNQMVVVDPFFARYGLQVNVEATTVLPLLDWGIRRKVNQLPGRWAAKINQRLDQFRQKNLLFSQSIKIPYGLCEECQFLAPWFEVGDDQLRDYYAFYLRDEYKQARTAFQPGFASLGEVMGSEAEAELRRQQHEAFLAPYLDKLRQGSADGVIHLLDYGGGSGWIIPRLPGVVGAVLEVEAEEEGGSQDNGKHLYDVVQCLHVLEHVGNPLKTLQRLLSHCRTGGLVYLEVPIEHPGIEDIQKGKLPICHEHVNKFNLAAMTGLLKSQAVDVLLLEEGAVDFLHLDGLTPVIRALARKQG